MTISMRFGKNSLLKLKDVDLRLQDLCKRVLEESKIDFGICEGLRTAKYQQELFKKGASQCDGIKNKSKHQLGKAIDFVVYKNGEMNWEDLSCYHYLGILFEVIAKEMDIKITWGGRFKWKFDGGHIEIIDN